jgi:hypothetical protein
MTDPNVPNFNPGGVKDRIDLRDYQWKEVGFGSAPFDWDKGFDIESELLQKIPVKDQNGSFSCGGQAWATYASVLEASFTGTLEERSAKYIYAQTYAPAGGSYGRDNADLFVKQGVSRETLVPSYEKGLPPSEAFMTRGQDITEEARIDAKSDKSFSYANVTPNIDSVAQAIRDNNGLILGVDGQNNGTWTSSFPKPPSTTEWRHWIYAGKAKVIDGTKYIGALNSWGDQVGDGGWQWLSQDFFPNAIFGAWTHVYSPMVPIPHFQHKFAQDLKSGDSGPEVIALQTALKLDGEFPTAVPCTGYFGTVTLAAVKKFQTKYKISPVFGFVGPLTRAKLNSLFS